MKKIVLIYTAIFTFNFIANAQTNLVPNPSFEIYSQCPSATDQLNYSTSWTSYRGSPDYFNSCATMGNLSVPFNGFGYQTAYDGTAYAGFIAFDINGQAREIIGSQLTQSLVIGQQYYVTIQVSLSEFDGPPPQFIPCNKIGVRFSTIPYQGSDSPYPGLNPAPINNFAHIFSNTIISDTMNWVKIQGSFVADSNYKYIMVGNFFDDINTDTIYKLNGVKSYFLVDDVCVSTSSMTCSIFTEVKNIEGTNDINIYPNPANSKLNINSRKNGKCVININNFIGKLIQTQEFVDNFTIDTSDFDDGVYLITVKNISGVITRKIIINH